MELPVAVIISKTNLLSGRGEEKRANPSATEIMFNSKLMRLVVIKIHALKGFYCMQFLSRNNKSLYSCLYKPNLLVIAIQPSLYCMENKTVVCPQDTPYIFMINGERIFKVHGED